MRRRNTFRSSQPRTTMIPKQQFVMLRKHVLDYLKRNAEGNGYCNIQHNSLDKAIMYARSREFHPFSGMNPEQRAQATDTFWATLVKAKQVEMVMAPVSLSGQEEKHYFLPGTQPFHAQTEALFSEIRSELSKQEEKENTDQQGS